MGIKISSLTTATTLTAADFFPIVQSSTTKRVPTSSVPEGFTNNAISAGSKMYLAGFNSTTYFTYSASSSCVKLYINNVLVQEWA